MPELLIVTPSIPNLPPKATLPRPTDAAPARGPEGVRGNSDGNGVKAKRDVPPADSKTSTAEDKSKATPANFAAALKQQMAQSAEQGQAQSVPPELLALVPNGIRRAIEVQTDLPLAADGDGRLGGEELGALIPLIEQLMPQWLGKVAAQPGADATTAVDDRGAEAPAATEALLVNDPSLIAAALPGAMPPVAVTQLQAATRELAGADTPSSGGSRNPLVDPANMALAAAISADEGQADASSGGQTQGEGDFAALIVKAGDALSAASGAMTAGTTATRPEGSHAGAIRMETPASHANWSNELGNKLTWMVTAQRQQADLVLNPPQLGRVEVSLTVSGDQASAIFVSPNAEVRELLEGSLPRLREILSGAGIQLGQAQVGAESQSQFANQDPGGRGGTSANPRVALFNDLPELPASAARSVTLGRGLVDTFV